MISTPTTLVLGAGASKPYGFPTGGELAQKLCSPLNLTHPHGIYSDQQLEQFSERFLNSGLYSIDAFLAHNGDVPLRGYLDTTYEDVGKYAIAKILCTLEYPGAIFNPNGVIDDHWYKYLWNRLVCPIEKFQENKLKIVTFNYDRSLEYFLFTTIKNTYNLHPGEAIKLLNSIPITHVYGQLGMFLGQGEKREQREFKSSLPSKEELKLAANSLMVIDEKRDNSTNFSTAVEYISQAERVCFLGFGFDETNVERLKIREIARQKKPPTFYASTFGTARAEREKIIQLLSHPEKYGIQDHVRFIVEKFLDLKSEQYLRETGVFL